MTKKMKVFLPRWILGVLCPLLAVVWAVITYLTFGTPEGSESPGIVGWVLATAVLLLVGTMLWLMTGRLPAYIIEMEEPEDARKP